MREKLIEVMKDTRANAAWHRWSYEESADYLIANGVIFATENNVGSKWIPVAERLPEVQYYDYSEPVLFFVPDNAFPVHVGYVDHITGDWKCAHSKTYFLPGSVTHWMPLPEAPEVHNT